MPTTSNDFGLLSGSASSNALRLLGSVLERRLDGGIIKIRIVETEAYDQTDAASHSYRPMSAATEVMFGPAGYLYVYFTYGMHYCCNVVVGKRGYGAAVLLRAAEPLDGVNIMRQNRRGRGDIELANGPAKICQALRIDKALNGHDLRKKPLKLSLAPSLPAGSIIQTARIGISQNKELPWRFYIKGSPYISKR